MGFTRRFSNNPGAAVIGQIEGNVIIDQATPGSINGIGSGVVAIIGEFADVTYGVSIDATGAVTTSPNPVEIFGGQDRVNKLGGLDETIGDFGGSGGNGWAEIVNREFARIVAVPVNLASSHGMRLWRDLPTNKSATNPAPVVAPVGAVVEAGREFKATNNRVRVMQRVVFAETSDFARGVDGAVTSAGSATSQTFSSASGAFLTVQRPDGTFGVKVGDALALGVVSGAGALGANADTYRVVSITSATAIVVEKQNGAAFDWTTGTAQPWRIHVAECADTGGATVFATVSGYRIPARPLDATIAASTALLPTVTPPALTGDNADPLSGLAGSTDATTGLVYTAAVQAPNAAASASIDALYAAAFDSLLGDDLPAREVNVVWPARYSATIDLKNTSHVLNQKANGIGRMAISSPPLSTVDPSVSLGDSTNGVGLSRPQEGIFSWPGIQTFATEAVGKVIKGADGLTHTDGMLDTRAAGWLAAVLSQLNPERNCGQASDPVKTVMSQASGIQRGIARGTLDENYYKLAKARGVCSPRNDRTNGVIFQSDVTRSLTPGETLIRRRRFSFLVQDTLAVALAPFEKELMTESLKDQILAVHVTYFDSLLSETNPSAGRIAAYTLDPVSGNTPELKKAGIFVVIHTVEMLQTADNIVQQSRVGYGLIEISANAAA